MLDLLSPSFGVVLLNFKASIAGSHDDKLLNTTFDMWFTTTDVLSVRV